ncbi:MAG: hypothetical protein ACOY3N_24025 [Bradyrhizobium sp.]|uniref:hypothetical protein n=1 Tax=Bradyrhizobium sp. TaxID=376 RepID=UPI003BF1A6C2
MLLHRVTPDPFQIDKISPSNIGQNQDSIVCYGGCLVAKFDRFGNGARRSDFQLTIDWSEIEAFIGVFAEEKNPAAVELKAALDLLKVMKEAGWSAPAIAS